MTRATELAEGIEMIIQRAYDAGGIQTFDDFETYFMEACNATGIIDDGRLRGDIRQIIQTQNPVFRALKRQEKEIHRPITNDSPIDHLPISKRMYNALYRFGARNVGDICGIIKTAEHGLLSVHNMGPKSQEEVFDALNWAGIEIPPRLEEEKKEISGLLETTEEDAKDIEEIEKAVRHIKEIISRGGARQIRRILLETGETFETGIDLEYLQNSERMIVFYYQGIKLAIKARRITIKAEG